MWSAEVVRNYFYKTSFPNLKKYLWKGNLNSENRSENLLISSRIAGFTRQMFKVVQVVFPSMISTVAIPASLLFTGLTSVFNGTTWVVRKTLEKLDNAEKELKLKSHLSLTNREILDAKEAIIIEKITVIQQMLSVLSGIAQIAFAVLSICSESVAKIFNYSPVLTGSAVTIALKTLLVGLGVISIIRAFNLIIRFAKCNYMLSNFRSQFHSELVKSPEAAISFIKKERDRLKKELGQFKLTKEDKESIPEFVELELTAKEKVLLQDFRKLSPKQKIQVCKTNQQIDLCLKKESAMGISYLTRRLGTEVAKKIFREDFNINKEFLVEIDKAMYKELFRQEVSLTGGVLMLASGMGSIVAAILTSGLSLMIVSLVSAVFSSAVESVFLSNEWTDKSDKLGNYFYERSKKPKNLALCMS